MNLVSAQEALFWLDLFLQNCFGLLIWKYILFQFLRKYDGSLKGLKSVGSLLLLIQVVHHVCHSFTFCYIYFIII